MSQELWDTIKPHVKTAMSDTLSDGIDSMMGYTPTREELREIASYLIGWFHGSLRISIQNEDDHEVSLS